MKATNEDQLPELSWKDLKDYKPSMQQVTIAGKRAYIRGIPFDKQQYLAELFQGRKKEEADLSDMKIMVACVLCDSKGNLIIHNPKDAVKALGFIDGEEIVDLFSKISDLSETVEDAEKNS